MSTTQAPKSTALSNEECFRRLNILDSKASALLRLCSMVTLLVTLIGLESNNTYASKAIVVQLIGLDFTVGMRELLLLFGLTAAFFVFAMFCMIPILHIDFKEESYENLVRKRMTAYLIGYWSCIGGMVSLATVLFLVFLQHYQK